MVGVRTGRFSYKQERELILMASKGATVSQIAARFRTTVETIERTAKRLAVLIRNDRESP
jgi:DNA-binding CsgD family transcriptional regulator